MCAPAPPKREAFEAYQARMAAMHPNERRAMDGLVPGVMQPLNGFWPVATKIDNRPVSDKGMGGRT